MCTLTYLPVAEGYLLTSSRDESRRRAPAVFPVYQKIEPVTVLMPQDPEGGGSWIATDDAGNTACLLNGAEQHHERHPPYRKSRGLVLLDTFAYTHLSRFVDTYDFRGIEPFTLVCLRQEQKEVLHQIQWDGQRVRHQQFPASEPCLWSSATLYDLPTREKRQRWFREWLTMHTTYTSEDIRQFHLHGGEGDPAVDFRMKRGEELQTVSLSSIESGRQESLFFYQDFLLDSMRLERLPRRNEQAFLF